MNKMWLPLSMVNGTQDEPSQSSLSDTVLGMSQQVHY